MSIKHSQLIKLLFDFRCALDIILETSMGFEMDIQNKRHTPYATAIANIVHIFQLRQFIPWYDIRDLFS